MILSDDANDLLFIEFFLQYASCRSIKDIKTFWNVVLEVIKEKNHLDFIYKWGHRQRKFENFIFVCGSKFKFITRNFTFLAILHVT